MIINVVVILFIAIAAYWFSNQGMFAALLHLLVSLVAGALAFAVWEPLATGLLLNQMPEYAWGVGLLAPFAVLLVLLRLATDKVVPGNVRYENLTSVVGGGIFGAISGTLTIGILIIALPMAGAPEFGIPDLASYAPYAKGSYGRPERSDSLWIPADKIAASTFGHLSKGLFHPWAGRSLDRYHPDLVREVSAFHYQMLADPYGLRAIREKNVAVKNVYVLDAPPLHLVDVMEANRDYIFVETEILKDSSSFHEDGHFRIAPNQIMLLHESREGEMRSSYPVLYVQRDEFKTFELPVTFAYSKIGVTVETFHWGFAIPREDTPRYLTFKHLRMELPRERSSDDAAVNALIDLEAMAEASQATDDEPAAEADAGPRSLRPRPGDVVIKPLSGGRAGADPTHARISDLLPFYLTRNRLSGVSLTDDGAWRSGSVKGIQAPEGRIGPSNRIDRIQHSKETRIVQILVRQSGALSLFGKVMENAAAKLNSPLLVDSDGDRIDPIGWARTDAHNLTMSIRDQQTERLTMDQLGILRLKPNEQLILYFEVSRGITINTFNLGGTAIGQIDMEIE